MLQQPPKELEGRVGETVLRSFASCGGVGRLGAGFG